MSDKRIMLLYWGRSSGGAKYTNEIIKELIKLYPNMFYSLSYQNIYFEDLDKIINHKCHINTYNNKTEFIFRTLILPFILIKIIYFIKINGIKIVYFPMHHLWSCFLPVLLKLVNVKTVLTVHDVTIHPGDGGFINQFLLDLNIRNSDRIICLTNSVSDALKKRHNIKSSNLSIIPCGANSYHHATSPKFLRFGDPIKIIFIGRISKYKGLDLLLEAWPKIKFAIPNAILSICGPGDISPYIPKIRADKTIICINKYLSDEEFGSLLELNHVAILPYIEASQSGVITSAFDAGMPVIVSPLSGLREQIAEGGGIHFNDHSIDSLVDSVIYMLSNEEVYKKYSLDAIEAAKQLRWEIISLKIFNTLD